MARTSRTKQGAMDSFVSVHFQISTSVMIVGLLFAIVDSVLNLDESFPTLETAHPESLS